MSFSALQNMHLLTTTFLSKPHLFIHVLSMMHSLCYTDSYILTKYDFKVKYRDKQTVISLIWDWKNALCPKSPSARGFVASLPVRLLFTSI